MQMLVKRASGPAKAFLEASPSDYRYTPRRTVRTHWIRGLALALLALCSLAALAHETDQYTLPVGRQFADLGPHFSRIVHDAIVEAVAQTNAAIKQALRGYPPARDAHLTDATAGLQSADFVAGKVWLQLFAAFPTVEILDGRLAAERMRARYPGLITCYRPEQSIYDDPLLLLDVTKVVRALFRACTVSADGKLFGTDKIIHFIHVGRIHHSSYVAARQRGIGEWEAVARGIQLSTGNNVVVSEGWLLGMGTTGVWSNADLAADYAGFKFYRNLTEEVRIGDRVMAPMLTRQGPYWRVNDQVHADSDFFTAFITPHWNEALNPNVYAALFNAKMRAILRDRCADALDWYRDERGRPRSWRQFADIEAELSTYYGEDYGYQGAGKDTVSIAAICFQPEQAAGTGTRSASELEKDLHLQDRSGVRSGSVQHAFAQASSALRPQHTAVDPFGRTRLWWAAKHGRLEEVGLLLAGGENPNAADFDGEAPLHAAARSGQVAVVELLLSHGADPGVKSLYGVTPLQVSVMHTQVGVTRALLRYGADANARDLFGKSSLHDAALRGNRELVALLLEHGADAGAADDSGTTPLHLALRAGSEALVKALSPSVPNPRARRAVGATPYNEVKPQGHEPMPPRPTGGASGGLCEPAC